MTVQRRADAQKKLERIAETVCDCDRLAPVLLSGHMGLAKVTTKLTSLMDSKRSFESLFLVDTGATDSMAPADELEKLGVKQEGKMAYELADGSSRWR